MQFFISYKSLLYADIESPFSLIGAFFMIFHVPRLFPDRCSTILGSFLIKKLEMKQIKHSLTSTNI